MKRARDIPIMFSAAMVSALLAGRKTMTRRRAWREPRTNIGSKDVSKPSHWQRAKQGDRLWVKETWGVSDELSKDEHGGRKIKYRSDGDSGVLKWKPSIFCPRIASRLTLIVTSTKIERLNDISEADALAEGVLGEILIEDTGELEPFGPCALMNFGSLWEKIHGGGSWLSNPEVVCLSFLVVKKNIDALPKE